MRIIVLTSFKFKLAHTGANVDILIKSVDQNGSLRLSLVGFAIITFKYRCWRGVAKESSHRIVIIGRGEASVTEVENVEYIRTRT